MRLVTIALLSTLTAAHAQDQTPGRVGSGAPEDLFLEVTHGPDGAPMLSAEDFTLAQGGYYRFNFVCPEELTSETGFHFEATELVEDSHIRVLSVGEVDIEFYAQGLSFRAVECDDQGSARFSFHPMRTGVYAIDVRDQGIPPKTATARVTVE
ncbi:hypothetical protein PARPLA_03145 [Rhodobacteraceae bacterium THAF1]|uniref:hypothetical protein n=1 Tax=Palleronia sp. THAF1 TaxID=2587842 RepID=UPI000F3AEF09|nr:hypothetical protein [Palleronia sp. THAF1]QFU08549.1 hypothetical protein FIU81_07680 [Palleronia sp. THAF1]VDC30600.1 hypothetical protein PARPLA_03145 [Rhodobacteraceae bacterium THAF1]